MSEIIKNIEVHECRPLDFNALVEVSACYIEIDEKMLLLKKMPHKLEGNTWGVPAGKLEKDETPAQGACRELFEETGIHVEQTHIKSLGALYVRQPEVDYVYHMFKVDLDQIPEVYLSDDEHVDFKWVPLKDILRLKLMLGEDEALQYYFKQSANKTRKEDNK